MARARILAFLAIALVIAVARVPAHHHPARPEQPWTDYRPKSKSRPRDMRVRRPFHWPSPCYLDTAPVVFPGPGVKLRPPFTDPREPPFRNN